MRIVRIHSDEGLFSAVLGKPGRIYTPYVSVSDYPVRKRRMANGDIERYSAEMTLKGKPYPVKKAAREMLRVGRQYGITKGAKALLNEARK